MGLWVVFVTVFLAELGDKTQLATLLFASEGRVSRLGIFVAASAALLLSTMIAVLIGGQLQAYVPLRVLKLFAGIGFIAIGLWVLWDLRV